MNKYFLLFTLLPLIAQAQNKLEFDPINFDYAKADSIALSISQDSYKNQDQLVKLLIEQLPADHEKLRSIFRWITNNIEYQYGFTANNSDQILKNRKAVCGGFSLLLKDMCNKAGIECEIVNGYSKTTFKDISKKLTKIDHAWNAVKLYGKWHLIDATWATSFVNEETGKFIKNFNEAYFLMAPEYCIKKHLPEDPKWQLLKKKIKKSKFEKYPIYYDGYFQNRLHSPKSEKGLIKLHLKDTFQISLLCKDGIEKPLLKFDDQWFRNPKSHRNGDKILIKQKFDRMGTHKVILYVGSTAVMAYKVVIQKTN